MSLENTMLTERCQTQNDSIYKKCPEQANLETENRLEAAWGWCGE